MKNKLIKKFELKFGVLDPLTFDPCFGLHIIVDASDLNNLNKLGKFRRDLSKEIIEEFNLAIRNRYQKNKKD